MTDELQTLLFPDANARAQLVTLDQSWKRVLENHPYPAAVQQMLGELVAASVLLSASLKFEGSLVLQIQGDGPVGLVVAECHSDLGIRATVKLRESVECPENASFPELVNRNGKGLFAVILDPKDRQPGQQPYQGIVSLEGDNVSECLSKYMLQSEQLETRLWLGASQDAAAGLMLQKMPSEGGTTLSQVPDEQHWERLTLLADTLRAGELLSTTPSELAHRLFWQEGVKVMSVREPHFRCSCSREKVARMLKSLGRQEVESALSEMEKVTVHCDYCNAAYIFDPVDCAALFIGDSDDSINGDNTGPTLHCRLGLGWGRCAGLWFDDLNVNFIRFGQTQFKTRAFFHRFYTALQTFDFTIELLIAHGEFTVGFFLSGDRSLQIPHTKPATPAKPQWVLQQHKQDEQDDRDGSFLHDGKTKAPHKAGPNSSIDQRRL